MARTFDDLRRLTALMRLVNMINEGLFTNEELKQFSQFFRTFSRDRGLPFRPLLDLTVQIK